MMSYQQKKLLPSLKNQKLASPLKGEIQQNPNTIKQKNQLGQDNIISHHCCSYNSNLGGTQDQYQIQDFSNTNTRRRAKTLQKPKKHLKRSPQQKNINNEIFFPKSEQQEQIISQLTKEIISFEKQEKNEVFNMNVIDLLNSESQKQEEQSNQNSNNIPNQGVKQQFPTRRRFQSENDQQINQYISSRTVQTSMENYGSPIKGHNGLQQQHQISNSKAKKRQSRVLIDSKQIQFHYGQNQYDQYSLSCSKAQGAEKLYQNTSQNQLNINNKNLIYGSKTERKSLKKNGNGIQNSIFPKECQSSLLPGHESSGKKLVSNRSKFSSLHDLPENKFINLTQCSNGNLYNLNKNCSGSKGLSKTGGNISIHNISGGVGVNTVQLPKSNHPMEQIYPNNQQQAMIHKKNQYFKNLSISKYIQEYQKPLKKRGISHQKHKQQQNHNISNINYINAQGYSDDEGNNEEQNSNQNQMIQDNKGIKQKQQEQCIENGKIKNESIMNSTDSAKLQNQTTKNTLNEDIFLSGLKNSNCSIQLINIEENQNSKDLNNYSIQLCETNQELENIQQNQDSNQHKQDKGIENNSQQIQFRQNRRRQRENQMRNQNRNYQFNRDVSDNRSGITGGDSFIQDFMAPSTIQLEGRDNPDLNPSNLRHLPGQENYITINNENSIINSRVDFRNSNSQYQHINQTQSGVTGFYETGEAGNNTNVGSDEDEDFFMEATQQESEMQTYV